MDVWLNLHSIHKINNRGWWRSQEPSRTETHIANYLSLLAKEFTFILNKFDIYSAQYIHR